MSHLDKTEIHVSYVGDDNELYEISSQASYLYALEFAAVHF